MKKILLLSTILLFSFCVVAANEDAPPVVDLSGSSSVIPVNAAVTTSPKNETQTTPKQEMVVGAADTTNLTIEQRVIKLEEQITFLQQQNFVKKITQLQQAIQDLRGFIEIQGHTIQMLQNQQHSQYADIDNRLSNLSSKQSKESDSGINALSFQSTRSSGALSSKELQLYESAFKLVKTKKYEQGILGMNAYLKKYPQGRYAANAHFWLGELFVIAGDSNQGKKEFQTVVSQFQNSNKVPDALLKLGSIAYENSQFQEAKRKWQKLVNRYPKSSAAKVAKPYLVKLKNEGL